MEWTLIFINSVTCVQVGFDKMIRFVLHIPGPSSSSSSALPGAGAPISTSQPSVRVSDSDVHYTGSSRKVVKNAGSFGSRCSRPPDQASARARPGVIRPCLSNRAISSNCSPKAVSPSNLDGELCISTLSLPFIRGLLTLFGFALVYGRAWGACKTHQLPLLQQASRTKRKVSPSSAAQQSKYIPRD
jgi:hypothetical protein